MRAEEKLQAEYQSWMNSQQGPVTASMQREYWRAKAIELQELYQEQRDCNEHANRHTAILRELSQERGGWEAAGELRGQLTQTQVDLAEARMEIGKLRKLVTEICRNAYACHYQQGTFAGDTDPCGQCANCMADKSLGSLWREQWKGQS